MRNILELALMFAVSFNVLFLWREINLINKYIDYLEKRINAQIGRSSS